MCCFCRHVMMMRLLIISAIWMYSQRKFILLNHQAKDILKTHLNQFIQIVRNNYIVNSSRHGVDANISRNICLIGLHKYMPMAPCYYRERNICCIIWNASKTFVLLSSKYNI